MLEPGAKWERVLTTETCQNKIAVDQAKGFVGCVVSSTDYCKEAELRFTDQKYILEKEIVLFLLCVFALVLVPKDCPRACMHAFLEPVLGALA